MSPYDVIVIGGGQAGLAAGTLIGSSPRKTRRLGWIDVPVFDAGGAPVHERGVTSAPGLYFLGLPWQHTRGSALLGWVQDDARHITDRIVAPAGTPPLAPAV